MTDIDTRHLVLQAAGECMCPEQYEAMEALSISGTDTDVYRRLLACIEKRTAKPAPTDKQIIDLMYECDALIGGSEGALLDFARAILSA